MTGSGDNAHLFGETCGAVFIALLMLAGALKSFSIARRPTTSTHCCVALGVILLTWLLPVVMQFVRDVVPRALVGVVILSGGITSIVLALVGLIDVSRRRDVYLQGRRQAWLALIITACMLGLLGFGAYQGLTRGLRSTAQLPAEIPTREEVVKFDDLNFQFRMPRRPWVRIDAKRINPDSKLALLRARPETWFSIIAEDLPEADVSTDDVTEIAVAHLQSATSDCRIIEKSARAHGKMEGRRLVVEARVSNLPIRYVIWIFAQNGYAYQLMTWSRQTLPQAGLEAAAEQLAEHFSLISDSPQRAVASARSPEIRSEQFGYLLKTTGTHWHKWTRLEKFQPHADAGLLYGSTGGLAIYPLILDGLPVDSEHLARAVIDSLGWQTGELTFAPVTGDAGGWRQQIEARFAYENRGMRLNGGLRAVLGDHLACCIVFWQREDARDTEQFFASWKLSALESVQPQASALNDVQKSHEVFLLHALGAMHVTTERYSDACEVLKRALALAPENEPVLDLLVTALLASRQVDEASKLLAANIARFPSSRSLLIAKAEVEMHHGELRAAKETLERVLATHPNDGTATSLLTTVSAELGEGLQYNIKSPIESVPVPDVVLADLAPDSPNGVATHSACHALWGTGIEFRRGKVHKETELQRVKILDARGASDYRELIYGFDPLSERIYVNQLEVRDAGGQLVARGDPSAYYVHDGAKGTFKKVLIVPVPGLKPPCELHVSVTREDLQPPDAMAFEHFHFVAAGSAKRMAVWLMGDLDAVQVDVPAEVKLVSTGDSRCWLRDDVEAFVTESLQPPLHQFVPTLWLGPRGQSWEQAGQDYLKLLADVLRPTDAIAHLAKEQTASLDSQDAKILALARYVQKNYGYHAVSFGRRARIPNSLDHVVPNRYGDCKDHALLLHALLSATGVSSHLALINSDTAFKEQMPSLDQFDHMIVYCPDYQGGRFFDCTEKHLDPSVAVPHGLGGRAALILDRARTRLLNVPPYPDDASTLSVHREIEISPAGDVSVMDQASITGYYAASLREIYSVLDDSNRAAYVKGALELPAESRLVEHSEGPLENLTEPLVIKVKYQLSKAFRALDGKLSGSVTAAWERHCFEVSESEPRRTPLHFEYPLTMRSEWRVKYPEGHSKCSLDMLSRNQKVGPLTWEIGAARGDNEIRLSVHCRRLAGTHSVSAFKQYQESVTELMRLLEQVLVFN